MTPFEGRCNSLEKGGVTPLKKGGLTPLKKGGSATGKQVQAGQAGEVFYVTYLR